MCGLRSYEDVLYGMEPEWQAHNTFRIQTPEFGRSFQDSSVHVSLIHINGAHIQSEISA